MYNIFTVVGKQVMIMKKTIMFLFNPNAGKGKVKSSLYSIIDGFTKMDGLVSVFPTQYKHHAKELIQEYAAHYDLIVCSGGDGTLNEVISGLMMLEKRPPLAYIPTGTVNDFATTLHLSSNVTKALETFAHEHTFACDICTFNQCYFTYVAAFGAFTEVSYKTPQATKNMLGRAAYFLESIKQLPNITTYHMKITANDRIIEDDFVFGAITNARSIAGFQSVNTKHALLDDGEFEVLLVRMPQNPLDLQIIITALLKQEINEKFMEFFTSNSLLIESDPKASWTLDGEEGGNPDYIEVTIKNKAVTFLV